MSAAPQTVAQPQFRNILFTTDFSLCSEAASPYARAIAERYGSTVHVVHIVSPIPVVIGGEFGGAGIQLEKESENTAHARMDELFQSGAFNGVLYTQTVQTGAVWDVLTNLIDDLNVDLIVMGTHGRRGMQHFLLGSVAEQVFRRAACPVLTVGPKVRNKGLANGNLNTIVFATDFSPASLYALDYGLHLARTYHARMTLLHSIESSEVTPSYRSEGIRQMEKRLSALVEGTGISFGVNVGCQPPVEMILKLTKDLPADLIVMGAHHGKSASTHAPWAVAHRVVCNAPCPVLTVRS
jgi:nucleotide-binding universal stress UspA family protein